MRNRVLTETGDYSFGKNQEDYITGKEAIAQAIKTKVLLFYGEWWENIGIGIPMFQSIVGQMNPEALKISSSLLIKKRIEELQEVTSVDNVEVSREGRTLKFSITVTTTEGQVSVEVNV